MEYGKTELFQLLQDETQMPVGNAPADILAVELTAGGLSPEHTNYVLSKSNREGKGFADFLDLVTYVPLFVEINRRIIQDPFNDSLDINAIGGLPENIYDIWEITGKRPEEKFTWDLMINDNLRMPNIFKRRCRFDRLYIRHSEPKEVQAEYFELCGLERLRNVKRFCSDHWSLLAHLNIWSKIPK